MIIGEGPGQQEVIEGRPFVGRSGQLLKSILESIGINMDECYLANATLAKPPPHNKSLNEDFPGAIESCLPRLEAEIEAVRPRVIVTVGAAAWIAISGYDITEHKRVHFECSHCDPTTRHVGPVLVCGNTVKNKDGTKGEKCRHVHFLTQGGRTKETANVEEVLRVKAACQKCGQVMKNVRAKMIKCPECGGRRMRSEPVERFIWDYNLTQISGAIFEGGSEPLLNEPKEPHHLGHWLSEAGVGYVIPTLHPAFLLRGNQFAIKSVQKHFQKAATLVKKDIPWDVPFSHTADPEVVRAFCWKWWWQKTPAPNFSVDIETDAVSVVDGVEVHGDAREVVEVTHIKCIGIGCKETGVLVVDTRDVNPTNPDDPLLSVLAEFLTDARIQKTYQNGCCYDIPVIDRMWGIPWDEQVNSYVDDTLHAHADLYPDSPHTLEHLTFEFTYARAWKPPQVKKGELVHANFEELALYNARDVYNTDACRVAMGVNGGKAVQGGRMWRADLQDIYEQDSQIRKITLGMTMRGMPLNQDVFQEIGVKARIRAAESLAKAREFLAKTRFTKPEEFKPSKDLVRALFETEGFALPVLNRTAKTQKPSTEKTELVNLLGAIRDDEAQGFIRAVLENKADQYVISNFVEALKPWSDRRFHPIWKPWGTRTGRFTSSPNFQNFPKWLRVMVEAKPGRKIVGADYDQLELRNIALLSGDAELTRRCMTADPNRKLEPDYDPHSYVAGLAFMAQYTGLKLKDSTHNPSPDVKCKCETCKRKALRDIIKRVIYGLGYGAGDSTVLAAIYDGGYNGPPITLNMIAHVRATIFKAFSSIEPYRQQLVQDAMKSGEIRSPLYGRRRIFPLNEVPITEIYNYPIQSFGADLMNERIIVLEARLPSVDPTAFIIAQVHDADYVECDENKAEAVAKLMQEVMTTSRRIEGGPSMDFTASAAISSNWRDAA
jgi:DNA polymerase I-like protein with 3'-5' exonuclease and polymerase domains/uracil-DNA glycosylase